MFKFFSKPSAYSAGDFSAQSASTISAHSADKFFKDFALSTSAHSAGDFFQDFAPSVHIEQEVHCFYPPLTD